MDRAFGYEPKGSGFKSPVGRHLKNEKAPEHFGGFFLSRRISPMPVPTEPEGCSKSVSQAIVGKSIG
jgi:hypothetical protein